MTVPDTGFPSLAPHPAPGAAPAVFGLKTWIWRNNRRSIALLIAFPVLIALVYLAICYAWNGVFWITDAASTPDPVGTANEAFALGLPLVILATIVWFAVAVAIQRYAMLKLAAARLATPEEARRVKRLLEPLCISRGLTVPAIAIIDEDGLNAFATGWSPKDSVIGVTRGLLDTLDDPELEAVLAHELTHIINRDTRLMIVAIVFTGIFTVLTQLVLRGWFNSSSSDRKDSGQSMLLFLATLAILALGRFIALAARFALSRSREFMADAGSVELTKNPAGLASALRKIAAAPTLPSVADEVQQMFILDPDDAWAVFTTHPPIAARLAVLDKLS